MFRTIYILLTAVAVVATGCSLLQDPDVPQGMGVVVLRIDSGAASSSATPLAAALATADSVRVCVYRPGTSPIPEVCRGAGLNPPASTVDLELTVIAENDKRVAVEAYQFGVMTFLGVNQNVDVVADQNTNVSITATSFTTPAMWRSSGPPQVADGNDFTLSWSPSPGGTYLFQESHSPDFSPIAWQTVTTDTFMPGPLSAGDYYFRVRNLYTPGQWSNGLPLHVYGPPEVTAISSGEVLRGDIIDVFGDHLDYGLNASITISGQACNVVGATPSHLQVEVPRRAFTDAVTISNALGSDSSSDPVLIQTIAYVMGDISGGDLDGAQEYKTIIDAYGGAIAWSKTAIVPYAIIDFLDMSVFEVIIVGWDTGNDGSSWGGGVSSRADAIRASGANVLAMGLGGAALLEATGLDIGLKDTQFSIQRNMFPIDVNHDIYMRPNDMNFVGLGFESIDVYAKEVDLYSVDQDVSMLPPGVEVMATRAAFETLFPFAEQVTNNTGNPVINFLWGFHGTPRNFTVSQPNNRHGRALFENVVMYLFESRTKDVIPIQE